MKKDINRLLCEAATEIYFQSWYINDFISLLVKSAHTYVIILFDEEKIQSNQFSTELKKVNAQPEIMIEAKKNILKKIFFMLSDMNFDLLFQRFDGKTVNTLLGMDTVSRNNLLISVDQFITVQIDDKQFLNQVDVAQNNYQYNQMIFDLLKKKVITEFVKKVFRLPTKKVIEYKRALQIDSNQKGGGQNKIDEAFRQIIIEAWNESTILNRVERLHKLHETLDCDYTTLSRVISKVL